MVRLLGALLLTGAGLAGGLSMARERLARVRALEAWSTALAAWGRELACRLPDTPELLDRLSKTGPAGPDKVFQAVLEGLDRLGEKDFSAIWREALAEHSEDLAEEDLSLLRGLGQVLGHYGWEDQRRAADRLSDQLAGRAERLEKTLRQEGRTYAALGLSAGACAAILLL